MVASAVSVARYIDYPNAGNWPAVSVADASGATFMFLRAPASADPMVYGSRLTLAANQRRLGFHLGLYGTLPSIMQRAYKECRKQKISEGAIVPCINEKTN